MSLPLGGGGVSPDDWWLHGGGTTPDQKISTMATGRTQAAFEGMYKPKVKLSGPWKTAQGIWNSFAGAISGAATNAVNALTMLGTLIFKVGGSVIDDVGDFLNAARANAQTALTNAGHAIGQITSLIGRVGGSFIDDVGDFINAAKANAQTALTNASISLANLQDFLDGLASAFGGASTGNNAATVNAKAVEIAEAALNAEAAAVAAQLAAAQASQGSGGSSSSAGIVVSVDVLGEDGAPLSAVDWGVSGPNAGDAVVRGTTVPCVGIAEGRPPGLYWVPSQHEFVTSNQRVEVVAGQGGSYGSASYLLIQCDAAYTEGAYLKYTTTGLDAGKFTRSGVTFTFTPFNGAAWAGKIGSGTRVEIQNLAHTYDFSVNGVIVKSVTDGAASVTMNASHLHTALLLERKLVTYNPGLPWETTGSSDSLRPTAALISDYIPTVYQGSGARMYRTSTAAAAASSGVNLLPASFFGVVGASTDDIVGDPATGKFTVAESGWYAVAFRVALDADVASNVNSQTDLAPYPMQMVLYRNGSVAKYVGEGLRPYAFAAGVQSNNVVLGVRAPDAASGSALLYLSAGDYVQLGYDANSGASTVFLGEATGTRTYFEIARLMESA